MKKYERSVPEEDTYIKQRSQKSEIHFLGKNQEHISYIMYTSRTIKHDLKWVGKCFLKVSVYSVVVNQE